MPSISRVLDDAAATRAFFRDVVEPLSDRFERRLVDEYVTLMAELPECDAARYERIRHPRPCRTIARDIVVLSRVTLGADVAVTSVVLDAVKRRFPGTRIWFAGPRKNFDLFAADPRLAHLEVPYPRHATLRERLAASKYLALPGGAIVVDPDSRITQLGLIPICPEDRYFFFESRSYGEETSDPLPLLTARWCADVFQVDDARGFVAPASTLEGADTAISLGVGGNVAKRLDAAFERELVTSATARGSVIIDRGASEEESRRVDAASAGRNVRTFTGDFADFAGAITRSRSYCGYDSAGQHVAAVSGVPLTVYFAGAINERFAQRWHPYGPGPIAVERR